MGMAMMILILIAPTDPTGLTGLTGRMDQILNPNRIDPAFNPWPDPDHRQAWVAPPACRKAVVARFGIDMKINKVNS